MQFQGTIKQLPAVVDAEYNGEPTAKRTVILESEPNEQGYTQTYAVEMFKKGEQIKFIKDNFTFSEGDSVKCKIDGKVNEYNGRFYNSLRVFKLEKNNEEVPF